MGSAAGFHGPGTAGRQLQKSLPMLVGLIASAEFIERAGQMVMGIRVVVVMSQRASESGHRQFRLPLLDEQATEIGPRFDVILVEFDGHEIAFPRSAKIPLAIEQLGQLEA